MDGDNIRERIEGELEVMREARRDAVRDIVANSSEAAQIYASLIQIQVAITAFEAVLAETPRQGTSASTMLS